MGHVVRFVTRLGICCGLLAGILLGAAAGQARPSGRPQRAGLAAHTFYAIAASTYQNWCKGADTDHCPPPARVVRFPARVQYVGFYFVTNYPTQNAGDMTDALPRFGIAIYTSAGMLLARHLRIDADDPLGWTEITSYFNAGFALIHAPQIQQDRTGSVYPDDTYRADLLIDGKPAAHTTFSVGSGRPARGTPAHPLIQAFYPAAEDAYSAWTDFGTVPPRVRAVRGGAQVFFYLRWANMPATLPLSIGILDPRQHVLVAQTGLFRVPRPSGYAMYIVVTPDRSPFAAGAYQGEVLAGDQALARVAFTIGE